MYKKEFAIWDSEKASSKANMMPAHQTIICFIIVTVKLIENTDARRQKQSYHVRIENENNANV